MMAIVWPMTIDLSGRFFKWVCYLNAVFLVRPGLVIILRSLLLTSNIVLINR